jgi:3-oxoacyl-[acyl-carrier-protein] synthase II
VGRRRVVITGLGVVAPNGIGRKAFWTNLVSGTSAVDHVSLFDTSPYPCKVAAEIKDFQPNTFVSRRRVPMMGRFAQFAVAAARLAAEDAGVPTHALLDAALSHGTAAHGITDLGERSHRDFLAKGKRPLDASVGLEYTAHAATAHIQGELAISGPSVTIASACCTGLDAIAWSAEQIRANLVTIALAGASDAPLSEFMFSLFCAGGYLSSWTGEPSRASRPYDLLRTGFVPSEGAAVLLLEEFERATGRGARILAEVLGYGSAGETTPAAREESYISSLARAISAALDASHLSAKDIDYICSHGNSIPVEDRAETQAHKRVFGEHVYRIPISSIKSMIGQPFAASGVMQTAAACLALHNNVAPPTINQEVRDPHCDLDYVSNEARVTRIRHALVHSHSLGGHLPGSHSALVLGNPDEASQ